MPLACQKATSAPCGDGTVAPGTNGGTTNPSGSTNGHDELGWPRHHERDRHPARRDRGSARWCQPGDQRRRYDDHRRRHPHHRRDHPDRDRARCAERPTARSGAGPRCSSCSRSCCSRACTSRGCGARRVPDEARHHGPGAGPAGDRRLRSGGDPAARPDGLGRSRAIDGSAACARQGGLHREPRRTGQGRRVVGHRAPGAHLPRRRRCDHHQQLLQALGRQAHRDAGPRADHGDVVGSPRHERSLAQPLRRERAPPGVPGRAHGVPRRGPQELPRGHGAGRS